ncbi:hypothetical protein CROQUDRAFT_458255 [Cronartium quercuum f. sp. fusiforme G11]|uniref:Uncharacterized protein n=1 Tax=Cronartium quercuum f. sp. fusiforme G11 TaxID=708437 RepID=A0A9P6TCQ0_9BASI|nr:hypothetical protein CROQUDRAFT_458255 [Cronartium quercuum f. sp. fusiforme G11]
MSNTPTRKITDTALLPITCSFLDFSPDHDFDSSNNSFRNHNLPLLDLDKSKYIYHTTLTNQKGPESLLPHKSNNNYQTNLNRSNWSSPPHSADSLNSSFDSLRCNQNQFRVSIGHRRNRLSVDLSDLRSNYSSPPNSTTNSCFTIPETITYKSPYSSLLEPKARLQSSTNSFLNCLNGPNLRHSISSSFIHNHQHLQTLIDQNVKVDDSLIIPSLMKESSAPVKVQVSHENEDDSKNSNEIINNTNKNDSFSKSLSNLGDDSFITFSQPSTISNDNDDDQSKPGSKKDQNLKNDENEIIQSSSNTLNNGLISSSDSKISSL